MAIVSFRKTAQAAAANTRYWQYQGVGRAKLTHYKHLECTCSVLN
jgi:hypothetical protein